MTVRKCARVAERYGAARRDARVEVPADELLGPTALAGDPRPDEAAALADLVEGLLRRLNTRDRGVVSLALRGYTPADIVAETGVPERTVYRALERARTAIRTGVPAA